MSAELWLQLILGLTYGAFGFPVDRADGWHPSVKNQTALHKDFAPSWVPEPRYRGTWGTLYSCLLTLLLCVYNAIHLNVPARDEGRFSYRYYRRMAKWALIALVAPEVVLVCAYFQWLQARRLCSILESWLKDHPSLQWNDMTPERSIRRTIGAIFRRLITNLRTVIRRIYPAADSWFARWDSQPNKRVPLVYGYYAVMGGFAVNTKDFPKSDKLPQLMKSRMTITCSGLLALSQAGVVLKIDRETINDKSKADVLAKGLVIFQVIWMVVQVVARKVKGLPLTLLEIHTLVHVFCALVMYGFWFKKPVRVRDPTMVDGPTGDELRKAIQNDSRRPTNLLSPRASNVTCVDRHFGPWESAGIFGILFFVIAAYGLIHFLAWNFDFPTDIESCVWKVVCIITVAGSVSAPLWLVFASGFFDGSDGGWDKLVKMLLDRLIFRDEAWKEVPPLLVAILYPYWWFSVIMAPLFVGSRVAIVVESFLSLRKVPEGAYVMVPWSQYIPHM